MQERADTVVDIDVERLNGWLADNVEGFDGAATLTKFAGGQSNPTYRLDGDSGAYVLRRKPFGPLLPSAHAIEREYRLLAALHPTGFPVAKPYGLCEDETVIGAPFYVMQLVEGTIYWDGSLSDLTPAQRTATYFEIVDRLAELHRIDITGSGLSDHGRPGNYFERQVARWTKQYRLAQTDDIPQAERLIEWLPRSLPPQERASIVHGDYRIDNMIFDPDTAKVRAVLDWELSTLGDPMADLSYLLLAWVTPAGGNSGVQGMAGGDTGIPTLEQMVERYCSTADRDGMPDLNWYFAFCRFRQMGIAQGIRKRFLEGNASNAEAEAAGLQTPMIAQSGWEFALKAGAD